MRKLLLVADAAWVRNLVAMALPSDVEVTELSDPSGVVDLYEQLQPDAVVVDLQVGNMGGMAITRALKSAAVVKGWKPVRIVMLLDRQADSFLAKRAGADAWLTKPVEPYRIRRALGIERPAPAAPRRSD